MESGGKLGLAHCVARRWVGMQAEARWSGFPTDLAGVSQQRPGVETRQLED